MRLLPESELIIIDIETTDIALADTVKTLPEIVEIGAVRVDAACDVIETFSLTVRPPSIECFSEHSERYTGIKRESLEQSKPFKECWRDFAEFTKFNRIRLASWGSYFDFGLLQQAYRRADLGFPHAVPIMDVLSMAYLSAGEWGFKIPRWSLKEACIRFDIVPEVKHRGLSGAEKAASVLHKILRLDEAENHSPEEGDPK